MLADPDVQRHVATLWGRRASATPGGFRELLQRIRERPALWQEAVVGLLSTLTSATSPFDVERFVTAERETLRESDRTWNAVGDVLARSGRVQLASDWLADWRDRTDVDASVMLRGADAMFGVGRVDECREIHARFEQSADDASAARHALWLAAEDVTAGHLHDARQRLQRLTVELPEHERPVSAFVQAALCAEEADAELHAGPTALPENAGGHTGVASRGHSTNRHCVTIISAPCNAWRLNEATWSPKSSLGSAHSVRAPGNVSVRGLRARNGGEPKIEEQGGQIGEVQRDHAGSSALLHSDLLVRYSAVLPLRRELG